MVTSAGAGSPRRAMVIGAVATVVCSLPVFFTAAMAVQLTDDLGFGTVGLGAAVATFFGTMALTAIYLGRVADRLGATLSLRLATVGAAIATFGIATTARDWPTLAVWLVLAGLAAALAQPAANRLLINRVRGERLATAFGLKQSAPPAASMLAGISVPVFALTVGWRWAFLLAGLCALLVALAVGPRPATAPPWVPRSDRARLEPLRGRSTLLVLAFSFGLAFAASSAVLAYAVEAAVRAGGSEQHAGIVFAVASLAAIATRLTAGVACDRWTIVPLRVSAALLGVGALGIGLMASDRPGTMMVGTVVALAGTWGFPGVFWFALVRAYPASPGRITGTMAPAAVGGIIGPLGFGALATSVSYPFAWSVAAMVAVLAAGAMLYGARRLAVSSAAAELDLDQPL